MSPLYALKTIKTSFHGLLPAEKERRRQAQLHTEETARVRNDCRATLLQSFTDMHCLPETEIDFSFAEEVDMAIRRLDLEGAVESKSQTGNGHAHNRNVFFEPLDMHQLREKKSDLRDADSRTVLNRQEGLWEGAKVEDRGAEDRLHAALARKLDGYGRLGPDGENFDPLPYSCGWLRRGYGDVLLDRYECFGNVGDTNLDPSVIDISDAYIAHEGMGKPHVFIAMINHYPSTDELL
ncbi:hypothetical protein BJX68DRAFT_267982 [Aspergillus pseudodeflectus]|uniref:Uncharacterized protein n=1 Tax=Aspergillus pseudodeflectus TaxID=176178 RepID=A0ABR4K5I7_9EURO